MKHALVAILLFGIPLVSHGIEPFVVEEIRVEGLQRISSGTVFNDLPVKVGDQINDEIARESIRTLFATGQFEDVILGNEGGTLVVSVRERPTVATIDIRGNLEIEDKNLLPALENLGLATGRVLNPAVLDKVIQELKQQYLTVGKYAAEIESEVKPLSNNRVALTLKIREGEDARIRKINFVGNTIFPDKKLQKEFELSTKRRLLIFSPNNEYSREQLQADLESLRDFYHDKGYLKFAVESTQVTISSDKKDIFVTVNVNEGDLYTVGGFAVRGRSVVPEEELVSLVKIRSGEPYSRRELSETRQALSDRLGDEGYAFANVNAIPSIDEQNKVVSFNFIVDPGRRVYVRRINIYGNVTTQDEVIRRELRQLEGGWYSGQQLQRSKTRLDRLGFFEQVSISTREVPGSPDQVDVDIEVSERSTGSFQLGVGYSDSDGLLFQAAYNQNNLFGTGRQIKVTYDNTSVTNRQEIQYLNPYYTPSGISRGFSVYRQEVNASEASTAEYITDRLGAGVNYRLPLSEFVNFSIGATAERVDLESTLGTPDEFLSFIETNPSNDNFSINGNIDYDTRDSVLFPTRGVTHRLSWEVATPLSDLEYYKTRLSTALYYSVTDYLIFKTGGEIGYGDGYGDLSELPFYENFFAGGATTVRGYDARSLGPRDAATNSAPIGGSRRVLANVELQVPLPGETKDKRIALFVDGGQVYGSGQSIDLGELRYSAGVAFYWFSPLGPLSLSWAQPLNDEAGDDVERVQFTVGRFFQ